MGIKVTHASEKNQPGVQRKPRPGRPFGMQRTPFNPMTGKYMPLGPEEQPAASGTSDIEVQAFKIYDESTEDLICREWDHETEVEGTENVFVAKPILYRGFFDEVEIDGLTYKQQGLGRRKVTDQQGNEWFEVLTPKYSDGDVIFAKRPIEGGTGVVRSEPDQLEWIEDSGLTGGRIWIREDTHVFRSILSAEYPDYLSVYTEDENGENRETFNVAKPYLLRQEPFHGQTRKGITYTYETSVPGYGLAIVRTCSKPGYNSIKEVITPSYQQGDEIYVKGPIHRGTGVAPFSGSGELELIEDAGLGGCRVWAQLNI